MYKNPEIKTKQTGSTDYPEHRANREMQPTYPNLVATASFRKISDPLDAIVVAFLEDLQEAHQETRGGEHKHLKVHVDRWPCPCLSMGYCRK